jgi:hypothetical protein
MQLPSGALDIALWRPDTEGPETNSSLRLVSKKAAMHKPNLSINRTAYALRAPAAVYRTRWAIH